MQKLEQEPGLLTGVYSYAEAARVLGVSKQRVRRWSDGYRFKRKNDEGASRPVLQTNRNPGVLSFDELWELFFVKEFCALGIALPNIRAAAEDLAKEVGPYPFSTSKLLVFDRQMLVRTTEGILKRPDIGQLVAEFAEFKSQYIEMDNNLSVIHRYNIPEFDKVVFLDKYRRGGEAVASERAIPTRIIYDLWKREKSVDSVGEYFELDTAIVSAAIRYEGERRLAS